MDTNQTPVLDIKDSATGCCPRFHPEGWDDKVLHFDDKAFVRASTRSVFHVPLNMGTVFKKTFTAIQQAGAEPGNFIVLSQDRSPWRAEHLFAVDKDVPGADMIRLSGDFMTKVFEGPFSKVPAWSAEMDNLVRGRGMTIEALYFFYTTCPKCAKVYGKNYVVGIAKIH